MDSLYDKYVAHNRKITLFTGISSVLDIDGLLHMPDNAQELRAEQEGMMGELIHKLITEKGYFKLLQDLSKADLDSVRKKNVELSVKDAIKSRKIPTKFEKHMAERDSVIKDAYYKARKAKDFEQFVPYLEEMIALRRKYAEYLGATDNHYELLLDEYDEGLTVTYLDPVFEKVKKDLLPIIKKLRALKSETPEFILKNPDPKKEKELFELMLKEIGFDFGSGNINQSPSSFMVDGISLDTRIYYRSTPKLLEMMGSIIHEGGHSLYGQCFDSQKLGLPESTAASMTIHESQSRLYENHIGYSGEYLTHIFPKVAELFPEDMEGLTPEILLAMANRVTDTARRVESDEISYHIHILIRYELEKDMISGKLAAKDLKEAWNAKYKEYLDIEFKDDGEGVLQDIHWPSGCFGYFPTYSLGTFYSAQFFAKLEEIYPDLKEKIKKGEFLEIKKWLNDNVHKHGRLLSSSEILERATGETININHFLSHIKDKYSKIYGVEL